MKSCNRVLALSILLGLSACKTVDKGSSLQSEIASQQRSQEIHRFVVDRLKSDGNLRGSKVPIWTEQKVSLNPDWIVQTPENYWGKRAEELPLNLSCTEQDAKCEVGFNRYTCESDRDCIAYNATCSPLQSSISKIGQSPKNLCTGSGDSLLERYYDAIVSAEKYLDVVTLAMPTGSFRTMFVNALTLLSQKSEVPKIRILLSSYETRSPILNFPPRTILRNLVAEIKKNGGNVDRLQIDLGYLNDPLPFTWNHAKILLVDSDRVVQGGHNFYAPDYTSDFPVFDLSMEYRGQGALAAQDFVNYLWTRVTTNASLIFSESRSTQAWSIWPENCVLDSECARARATVSKIDKDNVPQPMLLPPSLKPKSEGNVDAIGVTQLGSYKTTSSEATDAAFIAMFDSAKESIYIAQEDFFSSIPLGPAGRLQYRLGVDRSKSMVHLIKVISENEKLKIRLVQTDQYAPGDKDGYGMLRPRHGQGRIIEAAVALAKKAKVEPPRGKTLAQFMCEKFEYAPWRFTPGVRLFADGKNIGSHPKLIIIDESSFYLGSYNIYPSNLVEYGLIVSDRKATQDILDQYWNPLWQASEPDALDCNRPDSELLEVLDPLFRGN